MSRIDSRIEDGFDDAILARMSSIQTVYSDAPTLAKDAVRLDAPDLTRHPPRSPRTRLGGFVHLPRMIDKARAVAAGRGGDYHYPCPFDQRLLTYTGIDPDAFLAEVKAGRTDSELLAFVRAQSRPIRHAAEIAAWSVWLEQLTPTDPDSREFFNEIHRKNAPHREDIGTWFDWLELDDFVTFGGKA